MKPYNILILMIIVVSVPVFAGPLEEARIQAAVKQESQALGDFYKDIKEKMKQSSSNSYQWDSTAEAAYHQHVAPKTVQVKEAADEALTAVLKKFGVKRVKSSDPGAVGQSPVGAAGARKPAASEPTSVKGVDTVQKSVPEKQPFESLDGSGIPAELEFKSNSEVSTGQEAAQVFSPTKTPVEVQY